MSLALGLGPAPEDYEVAWETVRGCPGEPSVQQQIQDLVGVADPGEVDVSARLQVKGAVQTTDDGFEVRLTLRDPRTGTEETRRFSDPDCETATRLAVVLASVAIRTQREAAPIEARSDDATTDEQADLVVTPPADAIEDPQAQPSAPEQPAPAPDTRDVEPTFRPAPPTWHGSVGAVVDPTSVGAWSGGPRLGLFWRWRRVGLHLRGTYLLPRNIPWDDEAGATVSLGTAEVQGCWLWTRARFGFDACGGLELGALRARGFGVSDRRLDHALWASATLGAGLVARLSPRMRLVVEPGLLVSPSRSTVRFESPPDPIHRAPAVTGRLSLTLLFGLRRST